MVDMRKLYIMFEGDEFYGKEGRVRKIGPNWTGCNIKQDDQGKPYG